MLRNTESSASKISDSFVQFDYIGGCRAKIIKNAQYVDKTEYFLHFMFARIFQVVFLVADGLLVSRYLSFLPEQLPDWWLGVPMLHRLLCQQG
jgi:hypothetical protein